MTTFAELHARLAGPFPDHERFTGPPVDIEGLAPDELGKLWPLLQPAARARDGDPARFQLAHDVLAQARKLGLAPRLDAALLIATLRALPPKDRTTPGTYFDDFDWLVAQVGHLAAVPASADEAAMLEAQLALLLPAVEHWHYRRYGILAMARVAGARRLAARLLDSIREHYGNGLPARELEVLARAAPAALMALAGGGAFWVRGGDEEGQPHPSEAMLGDPHYAAFARAALEEAAQVLERMHAGEIPYKADFYDSDDGHVLALAARVGALGDEPWYRAVIGRLLPLACVAPTAARSAPSQSLTIALGYVTEAVPTPEGVAALRTALKAVRHAGLEKKLARNLKPAERRLATRPEVALRLAGLEPKQQRAMLAALLEACFSRPISLPYHEWRERLLGSGAAADFARTLVWRAAGSFMLDENDQPVDAQGTPVAIAGDAGIVLWHPVEADEPERSAWRARLLRRQLRQALRQAFREHYAAAPDGERSAAFCGYELDGRRLIGLAGRDGWRLEFDGMARQFGDIRAVFDVGRLYPGFSGIVASGPIGFWRGAQQVAPRDVPPRAYSEACRAVDLLVSVSAIALETDDGQSSWQARTDRLFLLRDQAGIDGTRRQVLERVLAAQIAAGTVSLEGFHVHVGDTKISLRTGRVLRGGAPVELALKPASKRLGAVPWLPYDEALLERVVHSVGALLDGAGNR
ncbi:DUF4132 domain-containing protein [Pseudoduganella umbonata]|uniref:DUF4132 domain-containing protein n=1 Tax=Pseudoduganella umbonata TaxID=864828 RepID=A0A4P8HI64_9BURK|nr:DUF4132 domain-containing protein [Pseudoduganella umbonata]MBB3225147.1 hypothetical protein [Pseudoduganella umbonata]QCP09319.1 DUF4132 domain-containing protein [Pseudoduganella umbonata]